MILRLLLWHCEFIEYQDRRRSTRPEELRVMKQPRFSEKFSDVLAAFTCVELEDNEANVNVATKEILSNLEMIGSGKDIVIVPFVHLSSKIAGPRRAVRVIDELILSLRKAKASVHKTSFGFHKDFELHFKGYGHPGSVCYRSIPQEGASTV
ncbi:MAG: hypothetical protein OEY88_05150 [Candidatus Bathyarchaeota archaeon]|nr:hypothetical protein [Candidatus Bathyarchaeota archaeon]